MNIVSKVLATLFVCVCTCLVYAENPDFKIPNAEDLGIKGKIKEYKRYISEGESDSRLQYSYTFGSKGEIKEHITFDENGDLESIITYTADEKGRLSEYCNYNAKSTISSSIISRDSSGNEIRQTNNKTLSFDIRYTYTYDDRNNLLEYIKFSGDSLKYKYTYAYDNKGNKLEENLYKSDGTLSKSRTWKYDEKGKLIETFIDDRALENKKPWFYYQAKKVVYTYDERGNEVEHKNYDSYGVFSGSVSNKYDSKNNIIEAIKFDKYDKFDSKETFAYDKKGKLIEKCKYNKKGFEYSSVYAYDKKGNEIEYCTFDRDSILNNKITKVYDKKGNIIETCEYVKSELTRKQSTKYDSKGRVIEYHEYEHHGNVQSKASNETRCCDSSSEEFEAFLESFISSKPKKEIDYSYKCIYDKQGKLIESLEIGPDNSLATKKVYMYDKHRNVIETKVFEDGKLVRILTNKIEYYK